MGISRIIALAAACLLAISGCGGSSDQQHEVDPDDAQTASPSTGGGDPEPDGGGKGDPAVSLPRLPVGGSASDVSGDGRAQCVEVRWSVQKDAANIPDGVRVHLTGVGFDPAVFEVASDVCGSGTPCDAYTFGASSESCVLGVRATDALSEDVEDGRVSFAGSVSCGSDPDTCADFLGAVAGETQLSIGLAFVEGSAGDDSEETDGTEETDGPEQTDGTEETGDPDEDNGEPDESTGGAEETGDAGDGTGTDEEPTTP